MAEPVRAAERHGYETRDVSVRGVIWVGLGLGIGTALVALALFGLVKLLDALVQGPAPAPLARVELVPPRPRLQVNPGLDLATLQAREQLILESYGWIDRDAGIARIPIERAMALLTERGWPNPKEGPTPVAAPPAMTGGGGKDQ